MKVQLIPKIAIENSHPRGMKSSTDMEYARLATEVANAMAKCNVSSVSADGLRYIALSIALYFEDVVADAGLWRGFTDGMKQRYGSYLPFFPIDEATYMRDEPNIDDVRFLVWYNMLEVHHGRVANPESPVLWKLADAAYAVLDSSFETVSVNDQLKQYLTDAPFADDFYKQRETLKWFSIACHLTNVPAALDRLRQQAQEMLPYFHGNANMSFYFAENMMPFKTPVGPLELLPQEWLAMTLRANGNSEAADKIGNQHFIDYQLYKVANVNDDDSTVTFENAKGETVVISQENLNTPHEEMREGRVVAACFVEYGGKWELNCSCVWSDDTKRYDELCEEEKSRGLLHDVYDKLVADNGGSRILYFADTAAMKTFLFDNLPFDEDVKKEFSLPGEHKDIALYIPEDYGDFEILPDAALCMKDERNPYYNEKMARNQALNLALSMKSGVRDYVISQGLLPDAAINSSKGLERGREIVQQNFSFIVRAVSSRL